MNSLKTFIEKKKDSDELEKFINSIIMENIFDLKLSADLQYTYNSNVNDIALPATYTTTSRIFNRLFSLYLKEHFQENVGNITNWILKKSQIELDELKQDAKQEYMDLFQD